MVDIRDAELPDDVRSVRRLWLDYLTWGNDEMEARHGFRLPVEEAVEHDIATIDKFEPPRGRLLLAFVDDTVFGTAAMRRVRNGTAEVKRMWWIRRGGVVASAGRCSIACSTPRRRRATSASSSTARTS
jgi:hypothetical protein